MGKGEETRQTILRHAARQAARVGLEGLSIGEMAKELGMSKSGLFAHFDSKEALQIAVIDADSEQFTDAVIRPALRIPRGLPRIEALFDGWLRWMVERRGEGGCLFVAASAELDDRPGPVRDRLVGQQRDWLEFIANAARSAVREGHLRADLDAEQLAFEVNGIYLSLHQARRLLGDPAALERARRAFTRLLNDARASGA